MTQKAEFYKAMLLIRKFEEKLAEIYPTDAVKSPVHLSIGQEAVAVGVCEALEEQDLISNTYRCHATHIAKGGDLNKMMAELYGKKDGCAGGKAGSMHLVEIDSGIIGASAVVGSTIPVAAGYALALKKENQKNQQNRILVCMFGDGATEEGCFSETINFAALHKLPMIFICENNGLAIHNPITRRWANQDICTRIATYNIPTKRVSSGDVFEIYAETKKIVEEIRMQGEGPYFMEIATYRYKEHVGPTEDLNEEYRDLAEYKKWQELDQIDLFAKELPAEIVAEIQQEVKQEIADAMQYAENSPYPAAEELYKNIYA